MTHPMHQIAKALSAYGRQGDTKLAHITAREEKILKSFGGIGSKNPDTGLVEYYAPGGPGSTGPGSPGSSGPGGSSSAGGGGGAGGMGGETEGAMGTGMSGGGQAGAPSSGGGPSASDVVGQVVRGVVPLGEIGTRAAQILGPAITGAIEDMTGLQAQGPEISFGDPVGRQGEGGGERARPGLAGPSFAGPGAVLGVDPLMRPEAMDIPSFLNLSSAQTPLQQRSQIATFGTQGVGGFGSEEAQSYWKNLVSRSFLDDRGGLVSGELLPIEQQYASQNLGLQPSGNMMEFLRAIA